MNRYGSVAELGDLVDLPIVAVLATRRKDDSLLLSPVWHEYRDGAFYVSSASDDWKVRHLRRDPRAVFLLYESVPPYRGIELTTSAELTDEGVRERITRIATRYLGSEAGQAYVDKGHDDITVRLAPGHIRAWDFADDPSLTLGT